MSSLRDCDKEKALAIITQLKGMTIAEAQELLKWCSDWLLEQPVAEWHMAEGGLGD